MQARSSPLVVIAACAAALLSFFAVLDSWNRTTAYNEKYPDRYRIARHRERLRGVAQEIPNDAVVGFISNLPHDELNGSMLFFATQYLLSPRLIVPYDAPFQQDYVLGNYTERADPKRIADEHGWEVVKVFGDGLILFRKETGR